MANFYKSNRKEVKKAMDKAKVNMLESIGKAAHGLVVPNTPVAKLHGGSLKNSIEYKVEKDSVYIGSTLTSEMYPIYIEKGTRYIKPRRYIQGSIEGGLNVLKNVAEKGYKL